MKFTLCNACIFKTIPSNFLKSRQDVPFVVRVTNGGGPSFHCENVFVFLSHDDTNITHKIDPPW